MADVWDIAQYVETHPDDYEQRWRLAKKMYLAWEYRLAVEHLQVLKNEWEERPNVRRYLGATLFRLQRYDDAVNELREATEVWPEDIAIRQQLARVLAAADRKEDAAEIWDDILEIEPDHEFGAEVRARLKRPKTKKLPPPLGQRASGRKTRTVKVPVSRQRAPEAVESICQSCGARNGPGFSECWQCQGSLQYAIPYEEPEAVDEYDRSRSTESSAPWVVFGLAVVALLSGGIYLTLQDMYPAVQPLPGERIPISMAELYRFDMMVTRLVCGVVLILAWPLAFRLADYLVGLEDIDDRYLIALGVLMGAVAYPILWLPTPYWGYGLLSLPLLSLIIALVLYRAKIFKGMLVWIVQGTLVLLVSGSVLAAFHGFDLIRDLPIIIRHGLEKDRGTVFKWDTTVTSEIAVKWEESESSWENRHANRIAVYATSGPITRRAFIEIDRNDRVLEFEELSEEGIRFEFTQIEPGGVYVLMVTGEEGVEVHVEVRGLLPIRPLAEKTPPAEGEAAPPR